MVIKIFRGLWLFAGLMISLSLSANNNRMVPNQVMMGNAVTWILEGHAVDQAIEKADLTELKQHFYIERVVSQDDRLRIKLFPYQAGKVVLQPIKVGSITFQPPVITVTENPQVSVEWQFPTETNFYQNQVIYWRAKIVAKTASLSMDLTLPEPVTESVQWLEATEVTSSQGVFVKNTQFLSALQLKQTGKVRVASPLLWVNNSTQNKWLFVAPTTEISVNPLPGFVPRNLPVGKLQLDADFPGGLVEKGALYTWRWQFNGQHLPVSDFPDLTEQLSHQAGFEWLSSSKQSSSAMNQAGLVTRMDIKQPFRVNQYGWVSLPSLRLTVFDVETGKLTDQFFPAQGLISVPVWGIWLVHGLGYLAMLIGLVWLGLVVKAAYLKWRLIHDLSASKGVSQIWLAIQKWRKNNQAWWFYKPDSVEWTVFERQSLGRWLAGFEERYGQNPQATQLVEHLNAVFYGDKSIDVQKSALAWARSLPNFDLSLIKIVVREKYSVRLKRP